jgi:hypothetical protein
MGVRADYGPFIQAMSRWFLPQELKDLDEEGIPIQISERFYKGQSKVALTNLLAGLASSGSQQLSSFERSWVVSALDLEHTDK